jgi:SAM-dependent methyltransferase
LSLYFRSNSISEVLAQDVIEHLHRWEAAKLIRDVFDMLIPGGKLIARLPNAEAIINAPNVPISKKLQLLFGGQDRPVDSDPDKNKSRLSHPEFFCHRYGWTPQLFHVELRLAGFEPTQIQKAWPNFIATSFKPHSR